LAGVASCLTSHRIGDIRDREVVLRTVKAVEPDAILHLAAQPLVLPSFVDPVGTFSTNVMGTVHMLDAARYIDSVRGVVAITTDKVYDVQRSEPPFAETAALGGTDPYAASKASAEHVIASYRQSFAMHPRPFVIESVRGGNIIGGGDFARHRIVPDYIRALAAQEPLRLRKPEAVRPWQHVISLVESYLILLERMLAGTTQRSATPFGSAWNIGPHAQDCISVGDLVARMNTHWQEVEVISELSIHHETDALMISSERARALLGWQPSFSIDEAIAATLEWYRGAAEDPQALFYLTMRQIHESRATQDRLSA
jgi:CDP-glucose 4,6-dehydratase